jgi:replicative DNA helicase
MNTLANPHIAKLRAAPEPQPRFDKAGDALERTGEDTLAAAMAEAARAERASARKRDGQSPVPAAVQVTHSRDKIIDALRAGEADTATLAQRAGVSKFTALDRLNGMLRTGRVTYWEERPGNGKSRYIWRLTRREAAE